MKKSEATKEFLEYLQTEEDCIFAFEEDIEEMNIVFPFMRKQGWLNSGVELTEENRKKIDLHLKKVLDERHGEGEYERRGYTL